MDTKVHGAYVLFSIDGGHKLDTVRNFLSDSFLVGDRGDRVTMVIGCYKGESEIGYMMSFTDYKKFDKNYWLQDQECVLVVNSDNTCYFAKPDLSETWGSNVMKQTTEPFKHEGWTYVPETGRYFTLAR